MEEPSAPQARQADDGRARAPATMHADAVEPQLADPKPTASARSEALTSSAQHPGTLTRVEDPSTVCMVNNQYMGRPQIPVQVAGRTYFGCCERCKGRLERDRTARFSTDPVSGRPVDKAAAVIGRDASNRVLYFESETTYRQYAGT